jgi:hypothetical protein
LQPALGTKIRATLVHQDRVDDVAVSARHRGSAIDAWKKIMTVADAAAGDRLARSKT